MDTEPVYLHPRRISMNDFVKLDYFSDMLCVWAYVSQIRLNELQQKLGDKIKIEHHFISLFGDTQKRIGEGWRDRGGYEGFSRHVIEVARNFPHVEIHPDIWKVHAPKTSAMSHLFIKAAQLLATRETQPEALKHTAIDDLVWHVRHAFFAEARDIGRLDVLFELAADRGLEVQAMKALIDSGEAMAALQADMEQKEIYKLEGSPSYLLNEGRQKLYGNVGYRVIEANVVELLDNPSDQASWC